MAPSEGDAAHGSGGGAVSGPDRRRGRRRRTGQAGTTIVELLVAALLAGVVLGAALTRLAARSGAAWALGVVLRDIALAGADPMLAGVVAVRSATPDRLELESDLDGDGAIDPSSAERLTLAYAASAEGRLMRWVGRQSMSVASPVPSNGFRLRYFAADGAEIGGGTAALDEADRLRVCRVVVELAVRETPEHTGAETRLRSAAAVRACVGRS